MERRALLMSTALSMIAMYGVYSYISNVEATLKQNYGVETSEVIVVASRDILQYETIRPTDIELIRVPYIALSPGRINDLKDVIDSVAAIPITKGEFILENKIISKNLYSGLDTQIALGKRAISIPVSIKSSVGFMVRPGNRVDLAAHFEYKSSNAAISEVKVFLQDLLVLASGRTIQSNPPPGVDQGIVRNILNTTTLASPSDIRENQPARSSEEMKKMSKDSALEDIRETLNFAKTDANFNTVTLEVTPQQAQIIVYVMTVFSDSIVCMLRHSDDRQLNRIATTNLMDIMGPESFMGRGPKAPTPRSVPKVKFYDYQDGQAVPIYQ